jgi:hypothetical protein
MDGTSRPVVTLVEGGIHIDFAGHFRRNIEDHCHFPMARKRNFLGLAERSKDALERLTEDEDFTWGLLALRFDMAMPPDDPDFISDDQLPERMCDLFDHATVARIAGIVDAVYEDEGIDIDTEHDGRNNEELQFTNEHALIILRWSYACVAIVPVITAFMDERDIQARDSVGVIVSCFGALLARFEPADGSVDIFAKIKKLVESRVLQTRYSDKVMWNYLRNIAVDPQIFIDRLFRKFIAEGIPKLEQGTNIIKFFQAFLKNQIKFQFTAKFGMHYKPVRPDVMDGEGVGAMEHLETELVRKDEGLAVLGDVVFVSALHGTYRELHWQPDAEDVLHWSTVLRESGISSWQRGLVAKFFAPKVGRIDMIKTRTINDYVRMLLTVRHWLAVNDFPALYDYAGARVVEAADGRRLLSRKKFIREFMDSAQYKELLGSLYGQTSQSIIDSGVIIEMIGAVHSGVFESLPERGCEPDHRIVEHRIETVAQEVLRFAAHSVGVR